jgi:hypothetical protein
MKGIFKMENTWIKISCKEFPDTDYLFIDHYEYKNEFHIDVRDEGRIANITLSEKRARELRDYLIKRLSD